MTSSWGSLLIPVLNTSNGVAAYLATSTFSIARFRLGMRTVPNTGSLLERGEKRAYFAPYFCAAREAVPIGANQTNQLVAFVDGNKVVLRGNALAVANPI